MGRVLVVLMSFALVGCASLSFRVSPGDGQYEMVLGARDCMDSANVIGSIVQTIPGVGDWVVANFGCDQAVSP